VVEGVREETQFEFEVVDIAGVDDLEARYRERIPVVEVDGVERFVYHVHPDALRRLVAP
jgi:Glutaredoxin-like domain (DUF836)